MRIIKFALISFLTVLLNSCEKDEIDLTGLEDYYFEYVEMYNYENDVPMAIDSVIFSFENPDSVFAQAKFYNMSNEIIYELTGSSYRNRKYEIDGNKIIFVLETGLYDIIPLFDLFWEVTSLSDSNLKIKNNGVNSYTLKCIKK